MAIVRHINRKGNNMVRVDNMQHILGDQWVLQLSATFWVDDHTESQESQSIA